MVIEGFWRVKVVLGGCGGGAEWKWVLYLFIGQKYTTNPHIKQVFITETYEILATAPCQYSGRYTYRSKWTTSNVLCSYEYHTIYFK